MGWFNRTIQAVKVSAVGGDGVFIMRKTATLFLINILTTSHSIDASACTCVQLYPAAILLHRLDFILFRFVPRTFVIML